MLKISHMVYWYLYDNFSVWKEQGKTKRKLEWSTRKQKEDLQMKILFFILFHQEFLILHSSNVIQPGNFTSLTNASKKAWKSLQNKGQTNSGRCKFHKTRRHWRCYQWFIKHLDRSKTAVKSRLYCPRLSRETSIKENWQKSICFLPINIYFLIRVA